MVRTSTRPDDPARLVERLLEGGSAVGLTEAQLVERFASRRDEAAFAALVDRHGPMVLGVCRRLLRDPNDADDAFQAVFLILARKADGLRRKDLVANWLYGVAGKVAAEVRRRPRPTTTADASALDADRLRPSPPDPSDVCGRNEDWQRLHEEVGRLPDRYRVPVVACYFEGRTHEEAAALLNWPVGTVKGRLARARDLLRSRLERRGVAAPIASLATIGAASDLCAAVPPALASRAVAGALAVVASAPAGMTTAVASTTVRSLSEGVVQAMFYAKLKAIATPTVLSLGMLAAGAGLAAAGRDVPQKPGKTDALAAPEPVSPPSAPAPIPETVAEYHADRPLSVLSPLDLLKLIDDAGKSVMTRLRDAEVDLTTLGPVETREEIDHLCDDLERRIARLRSAKVDAPRDRALLDAFADDLASLLEIRKGRGVSSSVTAVQDVEILADAYTVFHRSFTQAMQRLARRMETPEAARKRHALTIAELLKSLREPTRGDVSRPLLAAYADYLETIEPLPEAPSFRLASADAPPAPSADRTVQDVLKDVWKVVDRYQKSYQAATQSGLSQSVKQNELDEALARHRDLVGRLEKDLRARAGADPLLQSLADYLVVASKPPTGQPESYVGPVMTFSTINLVHSNLQGAINKARESVGAEPTAFDLELAREVLARARDRFLADSYRLAERDPEARDLLTHHAAYVAKLLSIDSYVFPPPSKPAPDDAFAIAKAPPQPATEERDAMPPAISTGGEGRSPSSGEMRRNASVVRQKVTGLSATLASVDKDPNNRKVHDALDRPVTLRADEGSTLRQLIELVKRTLKAEDGSSIPIYVDSRGLEDADVTLDSPVSIDLEDVPLKFSLRLALKQLDLAYCVRDGVLIISSLKGIEQELQEAQQEFLGAHPDQFRLDPNGMIRPIDQGRPGGMM